MSLDGRIRQGLVQAADTVEPNVEGDLMKVQARSRNRRRIQFAAGAVAVAAIGAFLFLGGTDLFDSTGDTAPIPPASTGSVEPTVEPTPDSTPTDAETVSALLEVWFASGERLYSHAYDYEGASTVVARATMENLLEAAIDGTGLTTLIPPGTELRSVDIADGIATVDLSEDFTSGGGSLSMRMRVAQVVSTLTQFDSVEGVLFEIEGERVDTIGGEGVDVSTPQTRDDFEDLFPAITVLSPGIDWTLFPGDYIMGTANVFEANVSWRILDENGTEIASGFATASCGTGCKGDYRTRARFSVAEAQEATLEVFEYSAENGEPINVVSVPVTLVAE